MQWSPDRNGGFSRADPAALALPAIMDALYGYETVNVEAQTRDVHSILHWTRKMIAVRRTHAAFGRGTLRFLYPKNRKVLAYLRELDGEVILCVANVSRTPQAVELDLSEFAGRVPVELNGGSLFPPVGQLTYLLTLPPYGFYWFILASETEAPSWHTPAPEPLPDYMTVVLRGPLGDGVQTSAALLERESLPPYLAKRRWFGAKDKALKSSRFAYLARLPGSGRELLLSEIEVEAGDEKSRWLLPLSISWEDEQAAALPSQLALSRVRRGRRIGLLTDAFVLPEFAREMLAALASGARIDGPEGQIVFEPMPDAVDVLQRPGEAQVMWLTAEQSNSSLVVDEAVMFKIFRRIQAGEHPEAEMSRYLTSHGFTNSPALLGEVARIAPNGERYALGIAQAFVRNQGDAWTWTLNQFNRALDNLASREATAESRDDDIEDYHAFAGTIGRQLGTMHQVLAQPTQDEAFAPRKAGAEELSAWSERCLGLFDKALDAIAGIETWESEAAAADAKRLLDRREELAALLQQLVKSGIDSIVTRIHGDFHLGQVLIASADAYIIDFEGEPARPLEERRRKASPMRDVAGLMRSFDYAAAATLDPKNLIANRIPPGRRLTLVTRLRRGAQRAFLAAYQEAAAGLPGMDRNELLDFFLAEKAAYEICYEAANRPAWVPIPLSGLSRLAARLLRETPPQESA
jgi:maltose alpha-D-glucosyltransferase/alpha-amylase